MRSKPTLLLVVACSIGITLSATNRPASGQGSGPGTLWPHTLSVDGANVVVYQPQAIEWPNHQTLTTREAITITRPADKTAIVGTTEISFSTQTDAATGAVILSKPQLLASHFPALDTGHAGRIEEQIKAALPEIHPSPVPLESVLLSLKQTSQPENAAINNDPPEIIYSAKPASLVVFDGEPVTAPVGQTGLSSVVNTNWDLFTDGKDWYLLNNGFWMVADAYTGPYQPISKLPPAFSKLPADDNFVEVCKAIPPRAGKPPIVPEIFVSTKPAEIIVTTGPPQFAPVSGTGLQSVKNSLCRFSTLRRTGRPVRWRGWQWRTI